MTDQSSFFEQLSSRAQSINSLLCIGLDPHLSELNLSQSANETERSEAAYNFCKKIIESTHDHAVCYKPNVAFFESLGVKLGMVTLRRVVDLIGTFGGNSSSSIPVLLDVKRGDIGSTAMAYAEACYDNELGLNGDGVTLSPLMGWDSLQPFITGTFFFVDCLYDDDICVCAHDVCVSVSVCQ